MRTIHKAVKIYIKTCGAAGLLTRIGHFKSCVINNVPDRRLNTAFSIV
jgi:hypothetical protein